MFYSQEKLLCKDNVVFLANLVTIIGLPLILLQLHNTLIKPHVDLILYRQSTSDFTINILNTSGKPARDIRLELRMANINSRDPNILNFIPIQTSFIAPHSGTGPHIIQERNIVLSGKYFGTATLMCDTCNETRGYILYLNTTNPDDSFYIRIKNIADMENLFSGLNISKDLDFLNTPYPNPDDLPMDRKEKIIYR